MKTRITELLGIEYPIIQGGMAWVATHELASAVSNAGGLGIIGAGGAPATWVRDQIRACKQETDKPFGVNLMLMNAEADEIAKVIAEEGVKVVTTGAGNPGKYISMWKEAGTVVIPVVASVALAKLMERSGVDAVIAEGTESGRTEQTEDNTDRTADQTENDRFNDKLIPDCFRLCTDCLPDTDFSGTLRDADEHDVHDADTADQQRNCSNQ